MGRDVLLMESNTNYDKEEFYLGTRPFWPQEQCPGSTYVQDASAFIVLCLSQTERLVHLAQFSLCQLA